MKVRYVVGGVLSVVAAEVMTWSIIDMVRGGDCGDVGQPSCAHPVLDPVGLFAGIALLIVASILTVAVGIPIALLVGGVTALIAAFTGPDTGGVLLVAGIALGLLVVMVVAGLLANRASTAREADLATFQESAERVTGVIAAVADTGMTTNDDPHVRLTVRYHRTDGTPAETTTKQLVSRLAVPRAGEPATIWYDATGARTHVELPGPSSPPATLVSELERLAALHQGGALTDAEYAHAKQRLLNQP